MPIIKMTAIAVIVSLVVTLTIWLALPVIVKAIVIALAGIGYLLPAVPFVAVVWYWVSTGHRI